MKTAESVGSRSLQLVPLHIQISSERIILNARSSPRDSHFLTASPKSETLSNQQQKGKGVCSGDRKKLLGSHCSQDFVWQDAHVHITTVLWPA